MRPRRVFHQLVAITCGTFLGCIAQPLFGQTPPPKDKPVIVVTQLFAPQNDAVAEKLSSTISETLQLVLRLTGSLSVQEADFLVPTAALERAVSYYKQTGAAGAVFGSVTPDSATSSYIVNIQIWNADRPTQRQQVNENITDLLSSFELADQLSLKVASSIVGYDLTEGNLVVGNLQGLTNYAVYADGELLGRNRSDFHVLSGPRKIVVAKAGEIGDVPIQSFQIVIAPDKTATVTLSPFSASPGASRDAQQISANPPAAATPARLTITVIPQVQERSEDALVTLSGAGGDKSLRVPLSRPFTATVNPGTYRLSAAFSDDEAPGYRSTLILTSGDQSELAIALNYSPEHQSAELEKQRRIIDGTLTASERVRSSRGTTGMILLGLGGAGGGVTALFYYLASAAIGSYNAATTSAQAVSDRGTIMTDRYVVVGAGIAGAVLLAAGGGFLAGRPSISQIAKMQEAEGQLNEQIQKLGAQEALEK